MTKLKNTLVIALSAMVAISLGGCGNAVDADAEPSPVDVEMPDLAYERDDASIGYEGENDPASCNLDRADEFVGMEADYEVRAELLEKVAPLVNVRWIGPNETAEDDQERPRLTVELDENEKIIAVRCG